MLALLFLAGCGGGGGGSVGPAAAGVQVVGGGGQPNVGIPPAAPNPGPVASTGALTFQFVRARAQVPTITTSLSFRFTDLVGQTVLFRILPFSTDITIPDVPTTARNVEIIALGASNQFLASLRVTIQVLPGDSTTLPLDGAPFERRLESIATVPTLLNLVVFDTQNLGLNATFSDGETTILPPNQATYESANEQIVTVDENGLVRAVGLGRTDITVSLNVNGVVKTTIVRVEVGAQEVFPRLDVETTHLGAQTIQGIQLSSSATLVKIVVKSSLNVEVPIDPNDPRLTVLSDPDSVLRGASGDILVHNGGLVWNTGRVNSQSLQLRYEDPALAEPLEIGLFVFFTSD